MKYPPDEKVDEAQQQDFFCLNGVRARLIRRGRRTRQEGEAVEDSFERRDDGDDDQEDASASQNVHSAMLPADVHGNNARSPPDDYEDHGYLEPSHSGNAH